MNTLMLKETIFQLPSQGVLNSELNLINGDSVKIRPFLAGDQKVMATRGSDPYRIYFNLLSRVIVGPEKLDVNKLLVSDANAILFAVRLMSFGPDYSFRAKCDNCDNTELINSDLSQIEVAYAEDIEGFAAETTITLPSSGDLVTVKLPTLEDEKFVATYMNGRKKKGESFSSQLDSTYIRLAQLITNSTGMAGENVKSTVGKITYVESMQLNDLNFLVEAVSERDCGIRGNVSHICSSCGWDNELKVSITEEFFRSNTRRSQADI